MSFGTKTSMWWGSVVTRTEELFGKEKTRIVAHEYYDNPNAPSARPKSMHRIGSTRLHGKSSQRTITDDNQQNAGSKPSGDRAAPPAPQQQRDPSQDQYGGFQQGMMGNPGMYPGDPNMAMGGPGMYPGDPNMMMGGPGMYPGDPNMMMMAPPPGMYPGDPNMMMGQPGMQ